MAVFAGPEIVESGLVLSLDAGNTKSYSGIGITVYNLVSSTIYPSVNLFGDTSYGSISNGVVNISGASNNTSSGVFLRGLGSLGSTINDDFTTIGWLYRTSSGTDEVMSYRESSYRCTFAVSDSAMVFNQRETVSPYTNNVTSVSVTNNLNTWYCYALSKSGNSWSFYHNGSLVGTNTFTMTQTIVGNAFHIGLAYSDDDYISNGMNGSVGPIMHYTRALTASEVQQNFNATRGRFNI